MYTDASTPRRFVGLLTVGLALLCATTAGAQDPPVRLPEVLIKAKAPPPGPGILVGIVVDTAGNVLARAEVTMPELARRILTSNDGTFRLDSIPKGVFSMRARKLGYAPQIREFTVDTAGGIVEFKLQPIPRDLPASVSSARRGGLSGVVGDTAFNPVAGAEVHVLGRALHAKTDSAGEFFIPALPGNYMVSITKDSFAVRLFSVSIPPDSGRRVRASLVPQIGKLPVREFWNVADLRERQAWIPQGILRGATLYTREQLLKMKIEWMYDAVQRTATVNMAKGEYDRDCSVVVNGGPAVANLATLTIDDVESLEVYATWPGSPTASAQGARNAKRSVHISPASNNAQAKWDNQNRNCPAIYAWLR